MGAPSPTLAASTSLDRLGRGCTGVVVGFSDELPSHTVRRLHDLGILAGVEMTMLRTAPLRDPSIFAVADYELALRRSETRRILVDPVA